MPSLLLEISVEELKKLLLQLPPAERLSLMEEIAEQSETLVMMQLSESGFQEWLEEGEDIYDAEAQELMRETERWRSGEDKGETEKDEKTGGHISRCAEIFRQCGSTALQKNRSQLAAVHDGERQNKSGDWRWGFSTRLFWCATS